MPTPPPPPPPLPRPERVIALRPWQVAAALAGWLVLRRRRRASS